SRTYGDGIQHSDAGSIKPADRYRKILPESGQEDLRGNQPQDERDLRGKLRLREGEDSLCVQDDGGSVYRKILFREGMLRRTQGRRCALQCRYGSRGEARKTVHNVRQ